MQNPSHSLCEYFGGHVWSEPLLTEDAIGNPVMIIACLYCPSIRYPEPERYSLASFHPTEYDARRIETTL